MIEYSPAVLASRIAPRTACTSPIGPTSTSQANVSPHAPGAVYGETAVEFTVVAQKPFELVAEAAGGEQLANQVCGVVGRQRWQLRAHQLAGDAERRREPRGHVEVAGPAPGGLPEEVSESEDAGDHGHPPVQ